MLIVAPDFTRRIDLPGVGPCPRPVDLDRTNSGLTTLVSLRVYSFAAGSAIEGEAEEDEVFVAVMRGRATLAVDADGRQALAVSLDAADGERAAYLPPHAAYRLTAETDCDVAYARARPAAARFGAPAAFAPAGDRLVVAGHAAGMALTLGPVAAGEMLALAGVAGPPERFVHVRGTAAARIGGRIVKDWNTVALSAGEAAMLQVEGGMLDALVIAATVT